MITFSAAVAALLMTGVQAEAPKPVEATALSSETIAQGRSDKAILALEEKLKAQPEDPALLINLGIAHAHAGATAKARSMFQQALVSPDPIELETADGRAIDSRRLARKAIRMLEKGEFATNLTRRD